MRAYNDGHIFDYQRILAPSVNPRNAFLHCAGFAAVIALSFAIIHFIDIFSNASKNILNFSVSFYSLITKVFFQEALKTQAILFENCSQNREYDDNNNQPANRH